MTVDCHLAAAEGCTDWARISAAVKQTDRQTHDFTHCHFNHNKLQQPSHGDATAFSAFTACFPCKEAQH